MERLEISIINYNSLNAEYRYEAEYFSKNNLNIMNVLMSQRHQLIGDFSDVTDGIHTSIDYDENSPVSLISATSPRENYFNLSRDARISEKAHASNPRTALRLKDVILSTVGTIGNCAVVNNNILPANCDRHVGIIRVNKDYSPYVVSTYLLSKYGRMQTRRETTGNVQPNLFLYKIREIVIPEYSNELQNIIEKIVIEAMHERDSAQEKILQAERLLGDEIGVNNWKINKGNCSIRSLKTILDIDRIDSEYYQLKYDDFESNIKKYSGGYTTPKEKFELIKTKTLRNLDEYKYVEIGDIDISNGSYKSNVLSNVDLPTNAKIMARKGDLLISTVRPYRGAVSILGEDDILVSGAFTVLRENADYPAETLQVLFRTNLYKEWLLKYNVGTSYPVIKDEDVLNIAIPLFSEDIHNEIKKNIEEVNKHLDKAKESLDLAKRILEIATEYSEEEALRLLD